MDLEWPHSVEAERAVLGICLVQNANLRTATRELTPDNFHVGAHRALFAAMLALYEDGTAVDFLTVTERMRQDETLAKFPNGESGIVTLTNGIPATSNIEHYVGIVLKHSIRRALMRIGQEMIVEADDAEDVDGFVVRLQERLKNLRSAGHASRWLSIRTVLDKSIQDAESAAARNGALRGVTSGFHDLDNMTDGWQPGQLIVVAGTSGMGKTAALIQFALAAAKSGQPVAFCSLEMGDAELGRRIFGVESGLPAQDLKRGRLSDHGWVRLENGVRRMKELPIYLDDPDAMPSIQQITSRCRRMQAQHGLGLVVVDYLQLVQPSRGMGSREQEVTSIGRGLKAMARALRVPVVTGCQLSKEADKRNGKPHRGDLRESGAIAHDADILLFVYRPWLQAKRLGEKIPEGVTENGGMLIIDKHRDGPEAVVPMRWNTEAARYEAATNRETPAMARQCAREVDDGPPDF